MHMLCSGDEDEQFFTGRVAGDCLMTKMTFDVQCLSYLTQRMASEFMATLVH